MDTNNNIDNDDNEIRSEASSDLISEGTPYSDEDIDLSPSITISGTVDTSSKNNNNNDDNNNDNDIQVNNEERKTLGMNVMNSDYFHQYLNDLAGSFDSDGDDESFDDEEDSYLDTIDEEQEDQDDDDEVEENDTTLIAEDNVTNVDNDRNINGNVKGKQSMFVNQFTIQPSQQPLQQQQAQQHQYQNNNSEVSSLNVEMNDSSVFSYDDSNSELNDSLKYIPPIKMDEQPSSADKSVLTKRKVRDFEDEKIEKAERNDTDTNQNNSEKPFTITADFPPEIQSILDKQSTIVELSNPTSQEDIIAASQITTPELSTNRRFVPLKSHHEHPAIIDPPQLQSTVNNISSSDIMNHDSKTSADILGTTMTSKSEPKSPRLTSPFSPKARRLRTSALSTTPQRNGSISKVKSATDLHWSMNPSRKVSILVNVTPNLNLPISKFDEESSLCLYPNIVVQQNTISSMMDYASETASFASNVYGSPARSIKSSYTVTSQTSIFHKAPTQPAQEIVLVNPKAFGTVIPTSITIETAKLVAALKNIDSEDWVRKFKFDEICWPEIQQLIGIMKNNTNDTIRDIGSAIVRDVKEGRGGRCVFSYGSKDSGRLESMFGFIAGNHWKKPWATSDFDENGGGSKSATSSVSSLDDPCSELDSNNVSSQYIAKNLGLLGIIVTKLIGIKTKESNDTLNLNENKKQIDQGMKFTLSMIEIAGEDVLKDLLASNSSTKRLKSPSRNRNVDKSLKIRHPDTKGAIVQNVVEETVTTISELEKLMKRAFHSKRVMKDRRIEGGRGHVIATLKVYVPSSPSLQSGSNDVHDYIQIQLVDLACAETDQMDHGLSTGHTKFEMKRVQERRTACIRKSMVGLRGVLRGLIVNEAQRSTQTISYRECTLTKLVQRSLSNSGSRTVVMATVCPRQASYDKTLHTLNYMNRLLVKPTKTAESPFETRNEHEPFTSPSLHGHFGQPSGDQSIISYASSAASETIQTEFISADASAKKEFLKSLVTDPRQRLASLLSKSPSRHVSDIPDLPMKEITTITEIDESATWDQRNRVRYHDITVNGSNENDISYDLDQSFDQSVTEQHSLQESNKSNIEESEENSIALESSNISIISKESSQDDHSAGDNSELVHDNNAEDDSVKNDAPSNNGHIFDDVLKQLDEFNKIDENRLSSSGSAALSLGDIDDNSINHHFPINHHVPHSMTPEVFLSNRSDNNDESHNVPADLAYLASDSDSDSLLNDDQQKSPPPSSAQSSTMNAIEKHMYELGKSMQSFVKSTNEPELINDLAADKLALDPLVTSHQKDDVLKQIAQISATTEALQSYLSSTQDQLEKSRDAERRKQQQINDLHNRMEQTQEEIQSLKSSSNLTLDQIRQDHIDALRIQQRNAMKNAENAAKQFKQQIDESILSREQLERDYLNRIDAMKKTLDTTTREYKDLSERYAIVEEELVKEKSHYNKSHQETKSKIQRLTDEHGVLKAQNESLSKNNDKLSTLLDEMKKDAGRKEVLQEEKICLLQEDMTRSSTENEILAANLKTSKQENSLLSDRLEKEVQNYQRELSQKTTEVLSLLEKSKRLQEDKSKLEQDLKNESDRNHQEFSKISIEAKELKAMLDEYSKQKATLDEALIAAKEENISISERLDSERERRKEVASDLARQSKAYEQENSELKVILEQNKNEIDSLKETIQLQTQQKQSEIQEMKSHLQSLKAEMDDGANQNNDLLDKLESKQNEIFKLNELLLTKTQEQNQHTINTKKEVDQYKKDLKDTQSKNDSLIHDVNSRDNHIKTLNETIDELTNQLIEVKAAFERNHESQVLSVNEKESKIASLQNKLSKSEEATDRLQKALDNESKQKEELLLEQDKKFETMNSSMVKMNDVMESQADEISSLKEETKRLYQSLKEEVEGKIELEKNHINEVASLKENEKSTLEAKENLVNELNDARTELGNIKQDLLLALSNKDMLMEELKILKTEHEQQQEPIAKMSSEIKSLHEKKIALESLLDSEKQSRKSLEESIIELKQRHEDKINDLNEGNKKREEDKETEMRQLKVEVQEKQNDINKLKSYLHETLQEKNEQIASAKNSLNKLKQEYEKELESVVYSTKQAAADKESEILNLKKLLDSRTEKYRKLKDKLSEIKSHHESTEERARIELNKSKVLNANLEKALKNAENNFASQIYTLRTEKDQIIEDRNSECDGLRKKLSDLRMVNESLINQNNKMLKKLQTAANKLENADKKKNQLYDSLKESERKMRSEMREIQVTMESAISKKNKELAHEKAYSTTIIEELETKIKELQHEVIHNQSFSDENNHLKRRIAHLEAYIDLGQYDTGPRVFDRSDTNGHYVILWRSEKEQRIKAEEFAAAMAARAKAGFEDRDETILQLRMKMSKLEVENSRLSKLPHSTALLLSNSDQHDHSLELNGQGATSSGN